MIRISVKTDNSSPVKIILSDALEPLFFHVEINRKRQNKPGQRESVHSREDVLAMVCDAIGWDAETIGADPVPPFKLPINTPVRYVAFDDDLMPMRRKGFTSSAPFLDHRCEWRVFVMGESKAVKLETMEVGR